MRNLPILMIIALVVLWAQPGAAVEAKKATTISALQAQSMLTAEPKTTFLIDVRTRAEYALLGHAPQAYNVPWRLATGDFQVKGGPYQGGKAPVTGYQLAPKPNPDFVGVVQSLFKPGDRLIVMSTDGDLGAAAADALASAGFKHVFNVRHGLLGAALNSADDAELAQKLSPRYGLRGLVNGWVFWGLPLSHQVDPRYVYPPDIKRMQTQK